VKVLYFGTYERSYPRNAQVISCLRRAGVEVVERHETVWDGQEHKFGIGAGAALRLAAAELRLLRATDSEFDALVVGYPGHPDLPAAGRVANGRPLVFNPLVSLADTLVGDRGRFRPRSSAARALETIDRRAFGAADLVVADTAAQAPLFRSLGARRVEVCFVGAEERLFMPGWTRPAVGEFTALFVGKLIPLHGLETILAAARLTPELHFRVVGSGQLQSLLGHRPPNVEHLDWVDYELLPGELCRASCALGIFGASAKAARVIPNKAFQALACGTPLVTAETPAAQELLRDGESALLVPPGDPHALASALRRLAADEELARRLSIGGLAAYREHASEDVLGARWRGLIASLL
jgi:glycosyltransferase involved in cell wall biosynthesis